MEQIPTVNDEGRPLIHQCEMGAIYGEAPPSFRAGVQKIPLPEPITEPGEYLISLAQSASGEVTVVQVRRTGD